MLSVTLYLSMCFYYLESLECNLKRKQWISWYLSLPVHSVSLENWLLDQAVIFRKTKIKGEINHKICWAYSCVLWTHLEDLKQMSAKVVFSVSWLVCQPFVHLLDLGMRLHFLSNGSGISLSNRKFFRRHLLDTFLLRRESKVRYSKINFFFCCNFSFVSLFNVFEF